MRHKVGDKVSIKSIDWYNENKDKDGWIDCHPIHFVRSMSNYCGKEATIIGCCDSCYHLNIDDGGWDWTDEMFEDKKIKYRISNWSIMNILCVSTLLLFAFGLIRGFVNGNVDLGLVYIISPMWAINTLIWVNLYFSEHDEK